MTNRMDFSVTPGAVTCANTWPSPAVDSTESILADQVRRAASPDDIMSALFAARPADRPALLGLRGAAMLRKVADLCGVSDAGTMGKQAAIRAITENF